MIFTELLRLEILFGSDETEFSSRGYLGGLLTMTVYIPSTKTLRKAISLLSTETRISSTGPYAVLVLGGITLTEITE